MSADTNTLTSPAPSSPAKSGPARLRIGTRGSPLALWQAHAVQAALAAALKMPAEAIAIEIIRTTGDSIQDRALSEAGGKGLFTKEIEDALLDGRIDLAVHSTKDVATELPAGLHLAGYLPRADVRDALILKHGSCLADLGPGAKVGTASLRRAAQLKRLRPDLKVELLRGNVHTRLARVREGDFDGTLLALAGLTRLGLAHEASAVLDTCDFLPAVGQGAVAIECRVADAESNAAVAAIACRATGIAVTAERAFLAALDGSCRTPIAGLATVDGERVRLAGLVLALDGSDAAETEEAAPVAEAAALGTRCGLRLRDSAPARALGL
ncbi:MULTISPECIES: hydroxymethylbilane synthase [unclassified Xanthobacter]|uniref:hydroxymethylbilane synthase n=1 Tax=unclassified Xanthobacter TaxID=2623496 RepID=UPI001EE0C986|nr:MULTISPECIES: hydroxymethylbilane synthase [unclassified Xanthobacter]